MVIWGQRHWPTGSTCMWCGTSPSSPSTACSATPFAAGWTSSASITPKRAPCGKPGWRSRRPARPAAFRISPAAHHRPIQMNSSRLKTPSLFASKRGNRSRPTSRHLSCYSIRISVAGLYAYAVSVPSATRKATVGWATPSSVTCTVLPPATVNVSPATTGTPCRSSAAE